MFLEDEYGAQMNTLARALGVGLERVAFTWTIPGPDRGETAAARLPRWNLPSR